MEKLGDFFNNLKDRVSNPLIFSFVCSWILWNWRIFIAMLWLTSDQIKSEGYDSVFCFVQSQVSNPLTTIWPIIFAIIYTLAIPIIKSLIKALNAWANTWGEKMNLNITKEGKVSISKYLILREDYNARTQILQKAIDQETGNIEKYTELETQFLETKNQLNQTSSDLTTSNKMIREFFDVSILNGKWTNTYITGTNTSNEPIEIIEGQYYTINDLGLRDHIFNIIAFRYDPRTNEVSFVKELTEDQKKKRSIGEHYNYNELKFDPEMKKLVGTENRNVFITYTRA